MDFLTRQRLEGLEEQMRAISHRAFFRDWQASGHNEALRLILLREVYRHVQTSVETLEGDDLVGPDLAYLLGAILGDTQCEWPAERTIVKILESLFGVNHPVWRFVTIAPPRAQCVSQNYDVSLMA